MGILDYDPTWSNVIAVMSCAVPVFLLNKRWVWSPTARSASGARSCPFWVFTLPGCCCPPASWPWPSSVSDSTLLVMVANIAGFGVLWVAKFLFLDQVMFGHSEKDEVLSQEAPAA